MGSCKRVVEYDGTADGLFSMQRRNKNGRWLLFTRGMIDKLLSFIISGRTTYTAATRHLSSDVLSFSLRRQDVVKLGTAAIKTFRIPAETARCPLCGPSPEFIVIDAQSLGCTDPDDTTPFRPAEDCPVVNIPAPKLCLPEHAPLRVAVTKVLRTATPLTTAQAALLRSWHEKVGTPGGQGPEAAAAAVFFRFFPLGRKQTAGTIVGDGGGASNRQSAAVAHDTDEHPSKRSRFNAPSGLEAALRVNKDGDVVLGGKGPPAKKPTDSWRDRKGLCAPAFDRFPREDDGVWIFVRPFLQAMLTETVTGMFQAFDERAVRLLANTLRLMPRGAWRSLTKAVDGVGFVAGFLGWFADLVDEDRSLRQAIGVLLLAAVDVERFVDDTFWSVTNNKTTLAAGWKNAVYCNRWKGKPSATDYKRWRSEQVHLEDLNEDDPLISYEYFAGLPRVRPGISDSEAAKRRVQYRGKERHVADLEGEGDACNKAFSIKAGLTQGVFNVVCPHVITLGFRCLFRAESVGEALSIVLERFSKLPKAIFYDVACKLDKNAMRRVRQVMRAHGVRCILDRPHSITHSCSPIYMPDECLGTTAGVATQAAEVSHSIAVVNRTSLAYMSPATYMYHRIVQVAFMNLRKLYRLYNGGGENDHVPLAPFFHSKISHQCERVTVCTCASATGTYGGVASVEPPAEEAAASGCGNAGAGDNVEVSNTVVAQDPGGSPVDRAEGAAAQAAAQDPWVFDIEEEHAPVDPVDTGTAVDATTGGVVNDGPVVDKADGMTVLRHTRLLAEFCEWAANRTSPNHSVIDTRPVTRAQRKFVDELTKRPLGKAVRPPNKARILILGAHYKRLRGEEWLTDELMNSFVELINHRSRAATLGPGGPLPAGGSVPLRAVMLNTYFHSRLSARMGVVDYDGVRRWGVKMGLNLNAVDVILVPILISRSHWLLVAVDIVGHAFHFYDSLSSEDNHGVVPVLKQWLHAEVAARLGHDKAVDWDVAGWRVVLDPHLPRQTDGGSCGIFVLAAADCFSLKAPLAFCKEDIVSLRHRVALALFFDDLDYPDHIPEPTSVSGSTTPAASDGESGESAEEVEDEEGPTAKDADGREEPHHEDERELGMREGPGEVAGGMGNEDGGGGEEEDVVADEEDTAWGDESARMRDNGLGEEHVEGAGDEEVEWAGDPTRSVGGVDGGRRDEQDG